MRVRRILILGGTREAAALAERLSERDDIETVTSLAGRTANPTATAGAVRSGGFGGVDGLCRYLKEARVDLLVDATHPFASGISANAAAAARRTATPRFVLLRPEWFPAPADKWQTVDDVEAAARALPTGTRAMLALGRQFLSAFEKRPDCFFLVRTIDPPGEPLRLASHELVIGRPGASSEVEALLLQRHAIDHLVCRNSGGSAGRAKLLAARDLGVRVIMIRRPPQPAGRVFSTLDDLVAAIG